jgi:hypothetical protein
LLKRVHPERLRSFFAVVRRSEEALHPMSGGKDGVIGRPSLWIAEDFGYCASG